MYLHIYVYICIFIISGYCDGPLTRYVKLRVAHTPGMPGTFSPPPLVSYPDMHHGTCVTHVSWCMPGSLTSGFLWSRWRGKRPRHSRRMRNAQFYVSGKRSMAQFVETFCRGDQEICFVICVWNYMKTQPFMNYVRIYLDSQFTFMRSLLFLQLLQS